MKPALILAAAIIFITMPSVLDASDKPPRPAFPHEISAPESGKGKTLIEECLLPPAKSGVLATQSYRPSEAEKPFYSKIPKRESGGPFPDSLKVEQGAYVSWFGIVRDIFSDESWPRGRILMVQVLYSEGLSDTHLQTVSINGPGDAFVQIDGQSDALISLMLVRFYGTVSFTPKGTPKITAEYIRYWPWGMFNFRDIGIDHSSPIWRQGTKVGKVRTYTGIFIDMDYYVERIGGSEEQIEAQYEWHNRNRLRVKEWLKQHSEK